MTWREGQQITKVAWAGFGPKGMLSNSGKTRGVARGLQGMV